MDGDESVPAARPDAYSRLINLLNDNAAQYRLLDHAPEGRTEVVSLLRGHDLKHAAKCLIVLVKIGSKSKKYVLAVVPGDRKLSLANIKRLYSAKYVGFASSEIAENLAGSVAGTILPFSFSPELELIADRTIASSEELYFNAAQLDRSIALRSTDYVRIANPLLESIVELPTE